MTSRRARLAVVAVAVATTSLVGAEVVVRASSGGEAATTSPAWGARSTSLPANGDWIAYSTAPHDQQQPRANPRGDCSSLPAATICAARTPYPTGSDVFLVGASGERKLVASRGDGTTWNVCPSFSPDGRRLAFGTTSPKGRAIGVVGVSSRGDVGGPRIRLAVRGNGAAPCPLWSRDGARVAYVLENELVVRGLDGSTQRHRTGDPLIADFRRRETTVSPSGDLVVRRADEYLGDCRLKVARPDGSDERYLELVGCPYAVAGWSPDGRKLLVMFDVSGRDFAMTAVSVDPPFDREAIVYGVRVNHGRSWPRYGDVSWQPRRP